MGTLCELTHRLRAGSLKLRATVSFGSSAVPCFIPSAIVIDERCGYR